MRNTIKISMTLGVLAGASLAMAQDVGRVLSSTPVVQQVPVPRQVCQTQQVVVQSPNSGAGAAIGMIAGAALGGASGGHRSDRAAASMIGAIGGAFLGNAIEGNREPEVRDVQRCGTQATYENRIVGYNVVYEFAGRQYSVQMPQDPGPTIALRVSPASVTTVAPDPYRYSPPPVAYAPAPVVTYTQPVYPASPAYPVHYNRPYVAPIRVDLQFGVGGGWGGGYYGHRHGHRW